jgi:hypothetical protein
MLRAAALIFALAMGAHADTLILKDGTKVTGRWWSADASEVHFLVDNALHHYARAGVTGVTFGENTALPPVGPVYTPPPPTPETRAVTLPPAPAPAPSLAPAAAPTRRITEPQETGTVYFRDGSGGLTPLERNQAAEKRKGSVQYWEMPSAKSPVRVKSAPELQFVVRLPEGTDIESYSLYPITTAGGARRTETAPGRKGGPVTLPFDSKKAGDSTYTLTIQDLAVGEYSFSPSGSNDAFCFGVDASGPGR